MSKKETIPAGRLLNARKNLLTVSVISLIFGILLMVWPQASLRIACKLIAISLILIGAVLIVQYLRKTATIPAATLTGGIITLLIGIWIMARPDFLIALLPTLIGILVLLDGLFNLLETLQIGKNAGNWTLSLVLAILSILAGLLLILKPLGIVRFIVRILGIVITYNSVSDLLIAHSMKTNVQDATIIED